MDRTTPSHITLLWMKLRKKQGSSGRRAANGLVAVSSAAVLAVYAAGYTRTQSAADKLDGEGKAADRRPTSPGPGGRSSAAPQPSGSARPAQANIVLPEPAAAQSDSAAKPVQTASLKAIPESVKPDSVTTTPVATAPAPTVAAPPAEDPAVVAARNAALPPWKDGSYNGWGTCRHGDIEATVVIEGGKIASTTIAQCLTRYSCDIIDKIIPQVAQRQSADVDYVSGATQSAGAFYWAVIGALGKAK